jgi:hypothetical protein
MTIVINEQDWRQSEKPTHISPLQFIKRYTSNVYRLINIIIQLNTIISCIIRGNDITLNSKCVSILSAWFISAVWKTPSDVPSVINTSIGFHNITNAPQQMTTQTLKTASKIMLSLKKVSGITSEYILNGLKNITPSETSKKLIKILGAEGAVANIVLYITSITNENDISDSIKTSDNLMYMFMISWNVYKVVSHAMHRYMKQKYDELSSTVCLSGWRLSPRNHLISPVDNTCCDVINYSNKECSITREGHRNVEWLPMLSCPTNKEIKKTLKSKRCPIELNTTN